MKTIGSRRQVWNGTCKKTSGGLTKSDLMMSHGRIVSRKKHFTAKKEMRLVKYGYGTQKGKFGYVKLNSKGKGKKGRSKRMRGGSYGDANWNGDQLLGSAGAGITDFGGDPLQTRAAMAGGKSRSLARMRSRGLSMGRSRNRGNSMAGGKPGMALGLRGGSGLALLTPSEL